MSLFTPTPPPGSYLETQTVRFTFTPEATGVMITQTEVPPSISKYIAYDTLVPPNPFIAVTEDGRGRVVYDGGFPKLYNATYGAVPSTFAGLNGAFKYMHNALKWIANPAKTSIGNNKVLILNDAISTDSYSVKSYSASGFKKSIEGICSVAGFTPTFKDRGDYGNTLNPTLTELEQYSIVWFFSTVHTGVTYLTPGAINDLVAFRQSGGGLLLLTDHGEFITNINTAITAGVGFFKNANALITRFGAYFTGDYNRIPVNVGFLRNNYGDHPLYNGLTNEEFISAGDSESKVVVTASNLIPPQTLAPIVVSNTGINIINILATTADGRVETAKYVYNIQGSELLFVESRNPKTAVLETNGGFVYAPKIGQLTNIALRVVAQGIGTVRGEVHLNGKAIGFFEHTGAGTILVWYAGNTQTLTPVADGDNLTFTTNTPFSYTKASVVKKDVRALACPDFSKAMTHWRKAYGVPARLSRVVSDVVAQTDGSRYGVWSKRPLSAARTSELLQGMALNKIAFTDTIPAAICLTTTQAINYLQLSTTPKHTTVVCTGNNAIYNKVKGSPALVNGVRAADIYGVGRTLQDNSLHNNGLWFIDTLGNLSKV
jgi:hypothetical protein